MNVRFDKVHKYTNRRFFCFRYTGISTNTSLISANVYTGDISANNTNSVFGKIDTLKNLNLTSNNIVSNTSTAIIANNTVLYNSIFYGNQISGKNITVDIGTANTIQSTNVFASNITKQ